MTRCAGRSSAICTFTRASAGREHPGHAQRAACSLSVRRGEELGIQPYDEQGHALRRLQLERPLDFAAVTDHAELIGEVEICSTPGMAGYDSWPCWIYREYPRAAFFLMNTKSSTRDPKRFAFCGEGGRLCLEASRVPWQEIQAAAEGAYDRSAACAFTSFVGYEWTGSVDTNSTATDLPATSGCPDQLLRGVERRGVAGCASAPAVARLAI
jgi:hypothetical protein